MVTKRSKTVAVKFLVIYIFLLRYFWSKNGNFRKYGHFQLKIAGN